MLSVEYWFEAPTLTDTDAEHVVVPAAQTRYEYELLAFFGSWSTKEPVFATVAIRRLLRKTSVFAEDSPLHASVTDEPESVAFSVTVAGGGGGAELERRTAPLVGPRVTELVVDPSACTYGLSSCTVTVDEVGLTSTVPPEKFRRQAAPTWNRAPLGEPTSAVHTGEYGSCDSGSLNW